MTKSDDYKYYALTHLFTKEIIPQLHEKNITGILSTVILDITDVGIKDFCKMLLTFSLQVPHRNIALNSEELLPYYIKDNLREKAF